MFERIFDCPFRVKALRNGPSGPILEGFSEVLCEAGYAEITIRRHIRAAEHFIYWTGQEGIPIASLSETESAIGVTLWGTFVPRLSSKDGRYHCT